MEDLLKIKYKSVKVLEYDTKAYKMYVNWFKISKNDIKVELYYIFNDLIEPTCNA